MRQRDHLVLKIDCGFLFAVLLEIPANHAVELVLDDFDEIRHVLIAREEPDELLAKQEVLVAELVVSLGPGHGVALLHLVDVPEGENKGEVHEKHALLAEVLDLYVRVSGVSVENHLDHLNFVLRVEDYRADHLVMAFTVVVADENL